MAALAGTEGYQAVPSADYELVPQEHAESSDGGSAPDAEHSDPAAVAAADAAVHEAIARLWLTADCLAGALAVVAVALIIAAARTNVLVLLIAVVVTAVPAATHACARRDGSNSALQVTLFVHMMAPIVGASTMAIICLPDEKEPSLTKLDGRLAGPMAFAYCAVAAGVWFKSLVAADDLKRVEGVPGEQPGAHSSMVAAARVQRDAEAARSEAAGYQQDRDAAARRQLKLRLEAAELRALEAFEAAKLDAKNGKLSCPWKAAEATLSDANWERWRAAADKLQLFNADPDAYIQQHGYN